MGMQDEGVIRDQKSLSYSRVGGNRRVPHVRLSVRGPKKMGGAQRSLSLRSYANPTSCPLTILVAVCVIAASDERIQDTCYQFASRWSESDRWAAPTIFGPRTLGRTWAHPSIPSDDVMTQTPKRTASLAGRLLGSGATPSAKQPLGLLWWLDALANSMPTELPAQSTTEPSRKSADRWLPIRREDSP